MASQQSLLINYNWHHGVNDQSKLSQVLKYVNDDEQSSSVDGNKTPSATTTTAIVEAIEADIIYSKVKSQAVMGHPPSIDGDLTLSSFLDQLRHVNFQQQQQQQHISTNNHNHNTTESTECPVPVLKLDFKSMHALQYSLVDIKNYLSHYLPTCLHERVWINADILSGPGEDLMDGTAQKKLQPKFDAAEFLQVVTAQLPGTTLSIGWTTSLTDIHAVYTHEMVNEMMEFAMPYSKVTFPIRASCFRKSWGALQKLYYQTNNDKKKTWTVTLWWSQGELLKEEFDWIYETLENSDNEELRNRTFYDLIGFRECLLSKNKH